MVNQLGFQPGDVVLKRGTWLQIDGQLQVLTDDLRDGDNSINVSPPLNYSVNSGAEIDYGSPGTLMRLKDGGQVQFHSSRYHLADPLSIELAEWL